MKISEIEQFDDKIAISYARVNFNGQKTSKNAFYKKLTLIHHFDGNGNSRNFSFYFEKIRESAT